MGEKKLHPTVIKFKSFINHHPKLRAEIRKSGRPWQEYYEKWMLLGEDDPLWEQYKQPVQKKEIEKKSELFSQLMQITDNIDLDKVQKQVQQLNGTITTIQELLSQFKSKKNGAAHRQNQFFNLYKD